MKRTFLCLVLSALVSAVAASQVANSRTEALIARGKSLELATLYVPPPGTRSSTTRPGSRRSCARRCL